MLIVEESKGDFRIWQHAPFTFAYYQWIRRTPPLFKSHGLESNLSYPLSCRSFKLMSGTIIILMDEEPL